MRLSGEVKNTFSTYFASEDLERVRLVVADPLPIAEPPLTNLVRRLGFRFPKVAQVAGITFDDVIACRYEFDDALLFHELVHAVEYRLLGVREFARLYAAGFLATRSYEGIPLERAACDLAASFSCGLKFSVEAELIRRGFGKLPYEFARRGTSGSID